MSEIDIDAIADLGDRLAAAVATLDHARRQLAAILPVMRQAKHPRLNGYLGFAHRAGFTLDELGQMIGCTRERIRQRIAAGDPVPKVPAEIPEADLWKLRGLHAESDGRSPRRRGNALAYRAELARLHASGVTKSQLAEALGVTPAAVWQQLDRHQRGGVS